MSQCSCNTFVQVVLEQKDKKKKKTAFARNSYARKVLLFL